MNKKLFAILLLSVFLLVMLPGVSAVQKTYDEKTKTIKKKNYGR